MIAEAAKVLVQRIWRGSLGKNRRFAPPVRRARLAVRSTECAEVGLCRPKDGVRVPVGQGRSTANPACAVDAKRYAERRKLAEVVHAIASGHLGGGARVY